MKINKLIFSLLFVFAIIAKSNAQEEINIKISDKIEIIEGKKFYIHKVEKGQTLYSIAKAYQIDLKVLEADTSNFRLKIDQLLKIPVLVESHTKSNINDNSDFIIHNVVSKETLYGISKKYNIDENSIINANPILKEGLKVGMILKIPTKSDKIRIEKDKPVLTEKTVKSESLIINKIKSDDIFNIALLIPLYLKNINDINLENAILEKKTSMDYKSLKFIQFYEGFMIVADSLAKQGMKLKIYIYDVNDDSILSSNFLKKNDLSKMDLIVGPFFYKSFNQIAEYAKNKEIPIINPFSERKNIIENNPFVFKLIPSYQNQILRVMKFIVSTYPNANILLVHNNKENEKKIADIFKKVCVDEYKQNTISEGSIKEIIYNQVGFQVLQNKLSKNRENLIVSLIENEIFVTSFVSKLRNIEDYNITLFAPLQWKSYDKIETEYFLKLNTHFFESSFVDYSNDETKNFIFKFREKYKAEPNDLAFKAHDIALYFLSALNKYNYKFLEHLSEININTIQTKFDFIKNENCGYENTFVNIYKMEEYKYVIKNK